MSEQTTSVFINLLTYFGFNNPVFLKLEEKARVGALTPGIIPSCL